MKAKIRDVKTAEIVEIPPSGLTFGRRGKGKADVAVSHDGVSALHARIYEKGGHWFIEDMGSSNGTYVDDRPINGPVKLGVGKRFFLSHYQFEVVDLPKPGSVRRTLEMPEEDAASLLALEPVKRQAGVEPRDGVSGWDGPVSSGGGMRLNAGLTPDSNADLIPDLNADLDTDLSDDFNSDLHDDGLWRPPVLGKSSTFNRPHPVFGRHRNAGLADPGPTIERWGGLVFMAVSLLMTSIVTLVLIGSGRYTGAAVATAQVSAPEQPGSQQPTEAASQPASELETAPRVAPQGGQGLPAEATADSAAGEDGLQARYEAMIRKQAMVDAIVKLNPEVARAPGVKTLLRQLGKKIKAINKKYGRRRRGSSRSAERRRRQEMLKGIGPIVDELHVKVTVPK